MAKYKRMMLVAYEDHIYASLERHVKSTSNSLDDMALAAVDKFIRSWLGSSED